MGQKHQSPLGPFILVSLVSEEAIKKHESKLGSFKKHFHHNYSGGTGRAVPSRFSPQASRSSGVPAPPSSRRSSLPVGLWPQVPAPGSGHASLRLKETAWGGQAGRPHRFSLGWESKSRVDGADPAAGSSSPLPIFNSLNLDWDLPAPS